MFGHYADRLTTTRVNTRFLPAAAIWHFNARSGSRRHENVCTVLRTDRGIVLNIIIIGSSCSLVSRVLRATRCRIIMAHGARRFGSAVDWVGVPTVSWTCHGPMSFIAPSEMQQLLGKERTSLEISLHFIPFHVDVVVRFRVVGQKRRSGMFSLRIG